MTNSYKYMKELLSQDHFNFLDYVDAMGHVVTGCKSKNAVRAAKFVYWLQAKVPSVERDVINAITITVDNETGGFRSTRESGYPMTESARKVVLDYIWGCGYHLPSSTLGNAYCPSRKMFNMESDAMKYRGTWWIQLTGRGNFAAYGQTSFMMRKKLTSSDATVEHIVQSNDSIMNLSSAQIDILSTDLTMNFLVTMNYLLKNKNPDLNVTDLASKLNSYTAEKLFKRIGYSNREKKNKAVPLLDHMVSRANNLKIGKISKNNNQITQKYEAKRVKSPREIKSSRKIQITRSIRNE